MAVPRRRRRLLELPIERNRFYAPGLEPLGIAMKATIRPWLLRLNCHASRAISNRPRTIPEAVRLEWTMQKGWWEVGCGEGHLQSHEKLRYHTPLDGDGPALNNQASRSGLTDSDFTVHIRARIQHFGRREG